MMSIDGPPSATGQVFGMRHLFVPVDRFPLKAQKGATGEAALPYGIRGMDRARGWHEHAGTLARHLPSVSDVVAGR
jgi:hypothetical protein